MSLLQILPRMVYDASPIGFTRKSIRIMLVLWFRTFSLPLSCSPSQGLFLIVQVQRPQPSLAYGPAIESKKQQERFNVQKAKDKRVNRNKNVGIERIEVK